MTPLRHLLLATTLLFLTISGAAVAAGNGGKKVGDKAFAYGETVRNDNLWTISRKVMPAVGGVTQNQVMAATLRRNPDAFFKGNVFYLRKGVLLTVPSLKEVRAEDPGKAAALFAHQEQAWKEAHRDRLAPDHDLYSKIPADLPERTRQAETKGLPAAAEKSTSPTPSAPPVASSSPTVPASATASDAPAAPPEPKPVAGSKAGSGPDQADVPALKAASDVNYLAYVLGFAALLAVLFLFLRSRSKDPAVVEQALPDPVAASRPRVALSMAGMETSQALESMAVTQQVVNYGVPEASGRELPVSEDEAGIKLKMAKAYLELKRDSAARALLEEVMLEGDAAHRAEAEKLMVAWRQDEAAV